MASPVSLRASRQARSLMSGVSTRRSVWASKSPPIGALQTIGREKNATLSAASAGRIHLDELPAHQRQVD
jgi:hypothetical protein